MTLNPSADVVTRELRGKVLLVTIDHAPVNALSADVRRGLLAAIEAADADHAVEAVLIVGAGRNFIAGADIREFGKPPVPPSLPDVCNRIEACTKPVVAAIHGAALGGGLEVALAAHYRVAVDGAKLGLPEVQLGLLPGAGGTQRAPRLIGAASRARSDAQRPARRREGSADARPRRPARQQRRHRSPKASPTRTNCSPRARRCAARATPPRSPSATRAAPPIASARAETAKKSRGLFSPLKIVEAVEAALEQPFDEGLRLERKLFLQCIDSPQRAGLIHAFFAEREVLKAPETRPAKPRPLDKRRRGRRRHDGCGHRGRGARRGPAGDDDRTRRRVARSRPRAHREGLRRPDRQRPPERGEESGPHDTLERQHVVRCARRRRPRHRSRVRRPRR